MRNTFFALLLALLCVAQIQAQVTGQILDARSQPVAGATVLLQQAADSVLVKGNIADAEGRFAFNPVTDGQYRIVVSMIGYENLQSETFLLEKGKKDLSPLMLRENSAVLSEAVVSAKRPFLEQKIDRTVVNVANSITNAGGNALEVLQRSPGVQVNRLTKTISLVGKEGVVVMINGKISRQPSDAVVQMSMTAP
jgi:hypothetical protein